MHRYAHSPLHREAWNWWNSITRTHPHLSISHEVYHAPKGCWENIYVNYHLTGIGEFYHFCIFWVVALANCGSEYENRC